MQVKVQGRLDSTIGQKTSWTYDNVYYKDAPLLVFKFIVQVFLN